MEDIPLICTSEGCAAGGCGTCAAPLSKGKEKAVFTANRAGEAIEEHDDLGHGVFTYY